MSGASTSRKQLADGDVLFTEGASADCAYIIESGRLRISTQSEGQNVTLCELGDGDIVGEMGVIDRAPRTASATAVGDTALLVVTREALTERIASADPIVKLLVKILLERYRSGLNTVKGEGLLLENGDDLMAVDAVGEYIHRGIDKIRLEAELKDALESGGLEVRYQPLLSIRHRDIAGFEALTRWDHPTRGQISPGLFISLAEETNLIVPVGLYVFEQACSRLASLSRVARERGYQHPLFMSINVSGRQITDADFVARAANITDQYGIDRACIKLEITESLAVDFKVTRQWIKRVHKLGFKVSLDDFGTGYSSLATLTQLNLDAAKVDQAFVRDLSESYRARELLRGIVNLMKGLNLEVIVEGIEDIYQLNFISALDCHLAQGWLLGRALSADEARDIVINPPNLDGEP